MLNQKLTRKSMSLFIQIKLFKIKKSNNIIFLSGHAALTLRSRLQCVLLRKRTEDGKDKKKPTTILVLNEVVVDRGPSPYISNIDLYLDGKHITSVQGDGKNYY